MRRTEKLSDPAVLAAQVRRMLKDPKAKALVQNFAGQWLELRRLESLTPDRERFPQFDDYLRMSIRQETGCNVVALAHDGGMEINPDALSPLPARAELIIVGDAESESRFLERFPPR